MDNARKNFDGKFFATIAFFVGVILVMITPPLGIGDEPAHFYNAYEVSKGDFFPEIVDGSIGRYVDTSVNNFMDYYGGKYPGKLDEKYSFADLYFDSYLPPTEETYIFRKGLDISPVGYFVSGLGMRVGSFLEKPFETGLERKPYNMMLYGRLANLTFYILGIFLALKITPCFKKTMLILSLMPMSIALGSTLSYDAIIIPVSFLFVSIFLRMMDSSHQFVDKVDFSIVLLCAFFFVGIKQAYAPLLILLFAVPKKKFLTRKNYFLCIGSVLVIGIIAYCPTLMLNHINSQIPNIEKLSIITAQQEYVKENCSMLPYIFYNTLKTWKNFYLEGFFGKLGHLDINFPLPLVRLFYIALIIVALGECMTSNVWREYDKFWVRIIPFISVIIIVFGIFLIMYLMWTPLPGIAEGVGTPYVSGVQGRYFIPLFLPTLLGFSYPVIKKPEIVECITYIGTKISIFCSALYAILTIAIVYLRYW